MAILYKRKNSKHWWIKYKDLKTGAWKGKDTGYATDGTGTSSARLLLRRTKAQEDEHRAQQIQNKPTAANHPWDEWVIYHMKMRWGSAHTETLHLYMQRWRKLFEYLQENKITHPALLDRDMVRNYVPWRKAHGGGHNLARDEVNLLAMILDYAIEEKWIASNPARNLRIGREETNTKPWSDLQVETVRKVLSEQDPYGWMAVTFYMGLYQSVRLFQCQVPLDGINFKNRTIVYPGKITISGKVANLVKGGESFTQVIFRPFLPILKKFVKHRRALGEERLCDLPMERRKKKAFSKRGLTRRKKNPITGILETIQVKAFTESRLTRRNELSSDQASLEWRWFLDDLGFTDISHHGLRARWGTIAVRNQMHPTMSMQFMHHKSPGIHRKYQDLVPQDTKPALDDLADKLGL
jgi:hypothetical protein